MRLKATTKRLTRLLNKCLVSISRVFSRLLWCAFQISAYNRNSTPVLQVVTHALFDLAVNLEYLIPLREEVEEVTKREGWSKSAVDHMHKLDSFLKESNRFNPIGTCKLV